MSNQPSSRTVNLVHFPGKDEDDPRALDEYLDDLATGNFPGGTVTVGEDDATPGQVIVNGGGNGEAGGEVTLRQPADHDATTTQTRLVADAEYFYIRNVLAAGGEVDGFRLYANGAVQLGRTNGFVEVGAIDDVRGTLVVRGDSTTGGARLRLDYGGSHDTTYDYYEITPSNGSLIFQLSNSTDLLLLNDDRSIQLPGYGAGFLKTDSSGNVTAEAADALWTQHPDNLKDVSTGATSYDWTGIPSSVTEIVVQFIDVSTTGASPFVLLIGDSGGLEDSGYRSFCLGNGVSNNTTSGFLASPGQVDAIEFSGTVRIARVNGGNGWTFETQLVGNATNNYAFGGGYKALSDTLDRLRLTTLGGTQTFDGGSVAVRYS